jgi:transposase
MNKLKAKQRVQIIKGTTYVYEDYHYWDSTKKQTRHKRKYIGKMDEAGNFIPNKVYAASIKLKSLEKEKTGVKPVSGRRTYYGATYLLNTIAKQTGIMKDLEEAFPDSYLKILSLASYLVMESDSPMYRFSSWAIKHLYPYEQDLSSQRISDLFTSIDEEARKLFFRKQRERRLEHEHLAYDTTSISSYSELIEQVRYGCNKDGESLPQINLALVFGQESMMPIYYRRLPGNITDVKTVRKLILDLDNLGFTKVKLVMDRGFYSEENLNALFKKHYKFLIVGKNNVSFIKEQIEKVRESIKYFSCYKEEQEIYQTTIINNWPYEERNAKGEVINRSSKRLYVHVYYNGQRAKEEKQSFIKALSDLKTSILRGTCSPSQEDMCNKFFHCKTTPKRGVNVEANEESIQEHIKTFGYFVLLSNEIKDPTLALCIYRNKDLIEKSFGNLKNRLSMKRPLVSSSESLEGKLFVQFVGLMLVSRIDQIMKKHNLYKNYSMQLLLDELDLIERFDYPGKRFHCSEITKKQEYIYTCFGVNPPNML